MNTRISIAQINSTVGDLSGNRDKIIDYLAKAQGLGADIVVFPELALTGYPPEDLLLKPSFIKDNLSCINDISKHAKNVLAIIGYVDSSNNKIFNAAALMYDGKIRASYHKICLPNYGVFDEDRYFSKGSQASLYRYGQTIFGVTICEDIWKEPGPVDFQAKSGAGLIISLNSSPYYMGKINEREDIIRSKAKKYAVPVVYANLVGGQDELVFDGQSMIIDKDGKIIARAEAFKEDALAADLQIETPSKANPTTAITISDNPQAKGKIPIPTRNLKPLGKDDEIYQALMLGLKDYVTKNGFSKVAIGLSGGIDSALVAVIACDALGKENVTTVFMPTRYTQAQSEIDAKTLASNLGNKFINIPIDQIYDLYLKSLSGHFAGKKQDIAEENLQARIRGNILMALSNKFGSLVLTTGNKSEMSTGYATLYGDMAGGLAVIKDVPKTLVYKLAEYRNSLGKAIPESIIKREPSAELRPEQKDSDSLPEYTTLDPIIKAYVEDDKSPAEIVSMGFDKEVVAKSIKLIDASEYKRRQAPPGIKITPKAFGRDRRMPITNRYR